MVLTDSGGIGRNHRPRRSVHYDAAEPERPITEVGTNVLAGDDPVRIATACTVLDSQNQKPSIPAMGCPGRQTDCRFAADQCETVDEARMEALSPAVLRPPIDKALLPLVARRGSLESASFKSVT